MPVCTWGSHATRPRHWCTIPCWDRHCTQLKPKNIQPYCGILSRHRRVRRLRHCTNLNRANSGPSSKMPCGPVTDEVWRWAITIPTLDRVGLRNANKSSYLHRTKPTKKVGMTTRPPRSGWRWWTGTSTASVSRSVVALPKRRCSIIC